MSDIKIKFNYSFLVKGGYGYHEEAHRVTNNLDTTKYGSVIDKLLDSIEITASDNLKLLFASKEALSQVANEQELNEQADRWLLLFKKVDELELSVRLQNCFKNNNLIYIGDLVIKTEAAMLMLTTPNFGRKSLNEIKEILSSYSLKFGMDVPEWPHQVTGLLEIAKDIYYIEDQKILRDVIKSYLSSSPTYTRI